MNWLDNLIQYTKTGNKGKCPYCGSYDIAVEKHQEGIRESITFTCEKCKKSGHYDGTMRK